MDAKLAISVHAKDRHLWNQRMWLTLFIRPSCLA